MKRGRKRFFCLKNYFGWEILTENITHMWQNRLSIKTWHDREKRVFQLSKISCKNLDNSQFGLVVDQCNHPLFKQKQQTCETYQHYHLILMLNNNTNTIQRMDKSGKPSHLLVRQSRFSWKYGWYTPPP